MTAAPPGQWTSVHQASSTDGADDDAHAADPPATASPEADAAVRRVLGDARKAGRIRRLRTSGPPFAVALTLVICGVTLFTRIQEEGFEARAYEVPSQEIATYFLLMAMPFALLSLQPSDTFATAFVLLAIAVAVNMIIITILSDLDNVLRVGRSCAERQARLMLYGRAGFDFAGYGTAAVFSASAVAQWAWREWRHRRRRRGEAAGRPPPSPGAPAAPAAPLPERITGRALLLRLWAAIAMLAVTSSASAFLWGGFQAASCSEHVAGSGCSLRLSFASGVLSAAVAIFALRPSSRVWVHSLLAPHTHGVASAAGVASIIGGARPEEILARGRRRMRAIPCDRLDRSLFATNGRMDNRWFKLHSVPAELGSVDAFVSHSWHDDPEAKWAALQAWRRDFKAREGGREPRIWFDRACIDQEDVSADLPFLPVYLAGCHQLLILCGTTYLQRMWCVVELLVFEQMGGDDVQMYLLPGLEAEALGSFELAGCRCALQSDFERLQSAIESAVGSKEDFNQLTRALLARSRTATLTPAELAAGASDQHDGSSRRSSSKAPVFSGNRRASALRGRSPVKSANPGPSAIEAGTAAEPSGDSAALATPRRRLRDKHLTAIVLVVAMALGFAGGAIGGAAGSNAACAECERMVGAPPPRDKAHAVRLGERRFTVWRTPATWREARAECARRGGGLATVSSDAQRAAVRCLLFDDVRPSWIGLSTRGDPEDEATWRWTDGSRAVAHNSWKADQPREPDEGGEPAAGDPSACASTLAGWWAAEWCQHERSYVCEFAID